MADRQNQLTDTAGIEETLGRWREDVKGKKRGIFSFEDLLKLKLEELKRAIYAQSVALPPWQIRECYYRGVGQYDYVDEQWCTIDVGQTWGGEGRSAFFRNRIHIPQSMAGQRVAMLLYLGGDSLVSLDGVPYHGLDPFRNTVPLAESAQGGECFDVEVESYYMWHAGEPMIKTLECSGLCTVDSAVEEAYWDYFAVYKALAMPEVDASLLLELKSALQAALPYAEVEGFDRETLRDRLREGQRLLHQRVYDNPHHRVAGVLDLIGHSHLDLVFLWDYAEFIRKAGRTHATMLRLMEQYPDFIFSQSQPVMYEELRVHYPQLFRQIQQRVREGRWEPVGAMWCEPDCNLISGESFVRQIQMGTLYFEQHFGVTPKTCWLPDVFGNAYTMPQILKKSGVEFFVTHKMNIWNDTNPWKNHAFWWEGPDGSRVFAAVPPTHFIGTMEPDSLRAHWNRFSEKDTVGESLYCYGWGDGGGGVDTEMLEYVKRFAQFPGLPRTRASKVEDALRSMRDQAHGLTVWKDELYLEAHRGVGTTKALLKKYNRRAENLYRAAEMMSVFAGLYGAEYPAEALEEGWRRILTAQFHDSLPGSHITPVFADLCREYERIFEIGERALQNALAALGQKIVGNSRQSDNEAFALWNFLGVSADNIAQYPLPDVTIASEHGTVLPSQTIVRADGAETTAFLAQKVPSVGYRVYEVVPGGTASRCLPVSGDIVIETNFYIARFNHGAEIESLYDKRNGREVVRDGVLNRFRLFEDRPGKYEAWDIVATYVDREIELAPGCVESVEDGEVCTVVTIRRDILSSVLRQNIYFYKQYDRIDFETVVDWRERRKLLKVEFPVDIASRVFTSDIAYGTIERSNCRYNPYDKAKFEVSAHNFIDLSDGDYGISLLNDCKYGHEVDGNRMMLTLLKGPMNPDPESDIGVHTFTYALYLHAGDFRRADTITRGLALNNPFRVQPISSLDAMDGLARSFVQVSAPNVTLEAVKQAQDGDGIIVRICEKIGQTTNVKLRFCAALRKACVCNLIERENAPYPIEGNTLSVTLKPYEVRAFRLWIE